MSPRDIFPVLRTTLFENELFVTLEDAQSAAKNVFHDILGKDLNNIYKLCLLYGFTRILLCVLHVLKDFLK